MKTTQYFYITPCDGLLEAFKNASVSSEFKSKTEPVLWSAGEDDKSSYSVKELNALVKLLFLENLYREYGSENEFSIIFPEFSFSTDFFDSKWSCIRVPLDMTLEDAIEDAFSCGTIEKMLSCGDGETKILLGKLM